MSSPFLSRLSARTSSRVLFRQQPPCCSRQTLRPQLRWQSSSTPSKPNLEPGDIAKTLNKAAPNASTAAPNSAAKTTIWNRLGLARSPVQAYGQSMRKRPYVTSLATAFFIFLCSDMSAQNISGKEYDPVRTCRSVTIGLVAAIPQYNWFLFLSKNFNYSSRIVSVATKVVINQLCFTPVFLTYFFGSQALLSGDNIEDTVERVKATVPVGWTNSWRVWPAAMVINFSYVPLEYRSAFGGLVAVGWQTYLSYLNRQAELLEAKTAAAAEVEKPGAVAPSNAIAA